MFTHQLMILWAVFTLLRLCRSAIMFSCSVVSDSLQPNGLQHTRLPCPSLSPGVCSNSCQLSQKCHPTTSSSVTTFYSCPPSFQASGSFPVSWPFASGDQSFGVSASASVLSLNIQGCFPLGLTDLISLLSKWKWKALHRVWLFATPWTVVCRAPLSMEFLRQKYWRWVAIPFSRKSSQPRAWTQVSGIAGKFLTDWATREALLSKEFSRVFSSTTIWKHQFFSAQPSL